MVYCSKQEFPAVSWVALHDDSMLVQQLSEPISGLDGMNDFDVIIPRGLIEEIKKTRAKTIKIDIGPALTGTMSRDIVIRGGGVTLIGLTINGQFPMWRRVIPCKFSGEQVLGNYDPKTLANLMNAAVLFSGTKRNKRHECVPAITPNGEDVALAEFKYPDLIGLIKPRPTCFNPVHRCPSWL